MLRPAKVGEDEEQCNDERYVEDTPPDWGDSHEDLNMAETQGSDQQSSEGEEADSPAVPWPWGPEGRPSDTGSSSTNGGAASCTTGASHHTAAEPTLARGAAGPGPHGPVFETTCVADKGTTMSK